VQIIVYQPKPKLKPHLNPTEPHVGFFYAFFLHDGEEQGNQKNKHIAKMPRDNDKTIK
jgi:hypothetical protein